MFRRSHGWGRLWRVFVLRSDGRRGRKRARVHTFAKLTDGHRSAGLRLRAAGMEAGAADPDEPIVCQTCEPDNDECTICLQPKDESEICTLPCGHVACVPCMARFALGRLSERRLPECPTCRAVIFPGIVQQLLEAAYRGGTLPEDAWPESLQELAGWDVGWDDEETQEAITNLIEAADPAPQAEVGSEANAPAPWDVEADPAFRSWARREHAKRCPNPACGVPIQKNGGCSNMVCSNCHMGFRWTNAPLICPCRGYHFRNTNGGFRPLGQHCPHMPSAQRTARGYAELGAFRAACAVAAAPVLVPVAATALAVAPIVVPPVLLARALEVRKKRRARERPARLAARRRALGRPHNLPAVPSYRATCRGTGQHGQHDLVAGWCTTCGFVDESVAKVSFLGVF